MAEAEAQSKDEAGVNAGLRLLAKWSCRRHGASFLPCMRHVLDINKQDGE